MESLLDKDILGSVKKRKTFGGFIVQVVIHLAVVCYGTAILLF